MGRCTNSKQVKDSWDSHRTANVLNAPPTTVRHEPRFSRATTVRPFEQLLVLCSVASIRWSYDWNERRNSNENSAALSRIVRPSDNYQP
jgi:hypothetical protein